MNAIGPTRRSFLLKLAAAGAAALVMPELLGKEAYRALHDGKLKLDSPLYLGQFQLWPHQQVLADHFRELEEARRKKTWEELKRAFYKADPFLPRVRRVR
jgi:hypothetical protein